MLWYAFFGIRHNLYIMRRIFIWEDLAAVAAVSAAAVTVVAVIMEQVLVAAVVSEVAVVHAEAVLAAVQDHTDQGQGQDLTMIMARGHIITEDPVCPLPHHQGEDIMVAEQPMYMQMAVPEAVPAVHLLQLFCSCSS